MYSFAPDWTLRTPVQTISALKLLSVAGEMKIYNEQVTLQSNKPREVFNITTRVKAAMEKSGFRDGVILVSSLHSNSAVIVNEEEPGFWRFWTLGCSKLAPSRKISKMQERSESGADDAAFQFVRPASASPGHACLSPRRRLDLGPGQAVLFVELDGLRPRRIVVKVMGE